MKKKKGKRPEWAPRNPEDGFASEIVEGVSAQHDGLSRQSEREIGEHSRSEMAAPRRKELTIEQHVEGVLEGDRSVLAQTITLIESNALEHQDKAQAVLQALLPHTGNSIRVGITGVPGVGKSTFIDMLGAKLTRRNLDVAVLAEDPRSSVSGGSILGDKTRMQNLVGDSHAFVRPSPSRGTLGGVARKSRETMLVCEAAGFDVIFVETVGVGQNEITVRSMVDFFLLLMIAGAGDELQGIKRGVMELADAVVINKADGENTVHAEAARGEYERALHYLLPATEGWQTQALTCSSLTGDGIDALWDKILEFEATTKKSGIFESRREDQATAWFHDMITEYLRTMFMRDEQIKDMLPILEKQIRRGTVSATQAARQIVSLFDKK